MKNCTYGAELELSDWPRLEPLAAGQGIDVRDVTMVNSDGVAVDPRGELYHLGGEIQTCPTADATEVACQLADIVHKWPQTTVNYRSNLHIHVRLPGLREDLQKLKLLQAYAHRWLPSVLKIIEPIPVPTPEEFPLRSEFDGARRRYLRRRISHQSLLKPERLEYQLQATSPEDFREREVRDLRTGALHWAIHPRLCFNLRQLWETDTIEFRHFPGTISPRELLGAVHWCHSFLEHALEELDPTTLAWTWRQERWLPSFHRYDHWLETGYKMTSRKYHGADDVRRNITDWLVTEEKRRAM